MPLESCGSSQEEGISIWLTEANMSQEKVEGGSEDPLGTEPGERALEGMAPHRCLGKLLSCA